MAFLPLGVGGDEGVGFHLRFMTEDFREPPGRSSDSPLSLYLHLEGLAGGWAVCMLIPRGLCVLPVFLRVLLCYLGAIHLRVPHKESWFPGMHADTHTPRTLLGQNL